MNSTIKRFISMILLLLFFVEMVATVNSKYSYGLNDNENIAIQLEQLQKRIEVLVEQNEELQTKIEKQECVSKEKLKKKALAIIFESLSLWLNRDILKMTIENPVLLIYLAPGIIANMLLWLA